MLVGKYNAWLVLASVLIAVLASYTALDLAGRVSETTGRSSRGWLLGGSVAMGIGIWSAHFLGMLAFSLPVPMDYDPLITFASLLIAIASSAFALWMVSCEELTRRSLCIGALVMGSGICSMHYTGMSAMLMQPRVRYIPSLFVLSALIAIAASGAALWMAFHLRIRSSKTMRLRSGAAVIMGSAIAGMHYTGMAAAQFPSNSMHHGSGTGLSTNQIAPVVLVFAIAVLSIALIVSMLNLRMQRRTAALSTSLDRAEQELRFLALHDSLTKLPNRALLEDRLDQEIATSDRTGSFLSVLFLDLDGFKQVNDAYGHQSGDQLLVEVAQRMRRLIRRSDTVARIGGDEFVVLARVAKPADAADLAEKLIHAIRQSVSIEGRDCGVSASIGIAIGASTETPRSELLKNADAAMYRAKALGGNTYHFFDASMHEDTRQRLNVVHDLRLAMEQQEFVLYYQPKFDAHDGGMRGVEALIRWNHPSRGVVLPSEFIPLAEKIGLIFRIGEWTIQEACRQMALWRTAGHSEWTVAVNLSTMQFNHLGLVELIQTNLQRYALDPGCLILEITESTAMRDPENSTSILQKLHRLGVGISIDDFGTGYSSLLYLSRLPASELKIDRGFIQELSPGTENSAIVSAIIALGRTLNLEIVAEGVETLPQREYLRQVGCHALQGFLLGRPMPSDQLLAEIEKRGTAWAPDEHGSDRSPRLVAQIPPARA